MEDLNLPDAEDGRPRNSYDKNLMSSRKENPRALILAAENQVKELRMLDSFDEKLQSVRDDININNLNSRTNNTNSHTIDKF